MEGLLEPENPGALRQQLGQSRGQQPGLAFHGGLGPAGEIDLQEPAGLGYRLVQQGHIQAHVRGDVQANQALPLLPVQLIFQLTDAEQLGLHLVGGPLPPVEAVIAQGAAMLSYKPGEALHGVQVNLPGNVLPGAVFPALYHLQQLLCQYLHPVSGQAGIGAAEVGNILEGMVDYPQGEGIGHLNVPEQLFQLLLLHQAALVPLHQNGFRGGAHLPVLLMDLLLLLF